VIGALSLYIFYIRYKGISFECDFQAVAHHPVVTLLFGDYKKDGACSLLSFSATWVPRDV